MPQKKQPQLSNFDRSKQYIESNNYGEFKKFIAAHPEVLSERNTKGKGSPLLHFAIENNNLNAVRTILEQAKLKNISLATTDKSGKQALDLAKEKSVSTKKASPIHDIYKLLQTQNNEASKDSTVINYNEKHTLTEIIVDKINDGFKVADKLFNAADAYVGRALNKVLSHENFAEAFKEQSSLTLPSLEESTYQAPESLTQTLYYDIEESQVNTPASWEELAEEGRLEQNLRDNSVKASKGLLSGIKKDENGNLVINLSDGSTKTFKIPNVQFSDSSENLLAQHTLENAKSISRTSVATTKVKLGINLSAEAQFLKGSGEVLSLPRGSASNNDGVTGDDLIVPSDATGAGRIQIGDILAVRVTPPGKEVHFKYGGIATSNKIIAGRGILGATISTMKFSSAGSGDSFRIKFGNDYATFKYKDIGAPNAARGEFNTLETLAKAINAKPGLKAKISDSKLYIGTVGGIDAISFKDLKGSFVKDLGLTDIDAEDNRFSTMNGLKDIMNKTEGLVATLSPEGGIDFHTELPTGLMKVHGIPVQNTVPAANTMISNATSQNERVVTITSKAHGLTSGDFVRIEGFTSANGATVPNGVYMVTSTPSGNSFTICSTTSATGLGAASSTDFTWTKALGVSYAAKDLANPNVTGTTGFNTITIADATHKLFAGDVIYVSGYNNGAPGVNAKVPDGYYQVNSVVPGASFTFTPAAVNGAGGPVALGHALTYQKIGVGTPDALDTTPIYTTCGSNIVRVYMPNHGKDVNEVFTFKGILSTAPIVANNIAFDNETSYIIKSVGRDTTYGDYFEYCTDTNANYTGFVHSIEQQGITVNEYSRLFKELNLSELDFDFGPSYNSDGGTVGQNLAEGTLNSNSVYTRPLTIYDSLGEQHDFRVAFAKLDYNIWAAEIYAAKNEDGAFDIVTPRLDGQIAAGTICFNGDGSLASVSKSLTDPIKVAWNNGAPESNVTFNWGTAGVPRGTEGATVFGDSDGMRQFATPFKQHLLDQDGGLATTNINAEGKGSKDVEYTSSGKFRLDEDGNLLDSKGKPLMAWKLDNEGRLPEQVSIDNLKPINFKSITGNPIATSKVKLGITLNAEEKSIPEKVYNKNLAEETIIHDSIYICPLTVYDSLGVQHNLRVAFAKLDTNRWAAEIYSAKNEDGTFDIETKRSDGQIVAGILKFNYDGSLAEVSESLSKPFEIIWKNYAFNSYIEFDWGTGQDGMRQVAAPFDQRFLDQDGVQPGVLRDISCDEEGYIIASFSNGGIKKLFKLPISEFADYNGLTYTTDNHAADIPNSLETDRVSAIKQDSNGNIVATYNDGSTKVIYSTPVTNASNLTQAIPSETPLNNGTSETQATNPLTLTTLLNGFIDTREQKTTIEAPQVVGEDKVVVINDLLRKSELREEIASADEVINEQALTTNNNSAIDYEIIKFEQEMNNIIDIQSNAYAIAVRDKLFNDYGKQSVGSREKYKNKLATIFKTSFETMLKEHRAYPEKDCFKAFIEQTITWDKDKLVGNIQANTFSYSDGSGLTDIIYSCTKFSSVFTYLFGRVSLPDQNIQIAIEKTIKHLEDKYASFKGEYMLKDLNQEELFEPTLSKSQELKLEQEKEAKLKELASNDDTQVEVINAEAIAVPNDPLNNVFPVGDIYVRSDEV
jgi:flagellar hook protein FlgE